MSRLKGREEDENDKLVPDGSVKLLLSNVEELYAVIRLFYNDVGLVSGA